MPNKDSTWLEENAMPPSRKDQLLRKRRWRLPVSVVALLVVVLAACQAIPIPVHLGQLSAPPAAAQPTAEPVSPEVDRVGFPEGYQEIFQIFYEFDRPDNRTARVIYANEVAASVSPEIYATAPVAPGSPFPYGSVLVMEVYRTPRDEAGNVILDENGRFTREELSGIFVMRKEAGYGAKYGAQRNGEWEYVAYRPDGSFLTPPERTGACAACHVEAGQGRDWIFGAEHAWGTTHTAGENEVILDDYTFTPQVITVTVGSEVTWTSKDVVFHTVNAEDWTFNSGMVRPNASFRQTFELPGEYNYICSVHPSMRGTVVVEEAE
jgi:plastocyanin